MKTTLRALAALTLTLALAGPAAAQDDDPDTTYDFEDDDVQGEYRSPLGEMLVVRQGAGRTSLIRPRGHYMPELLKSVESI